MSPRNGEREAHIPDSSIHLPSASAPYVAHSHAAPFTYHLAGSMGWNSDPQQHVQQQRSPQKPFNVALYAIHAEEKPHQQVHVHGYTHFNPHYNPRQQQHVQPQEDVLMSSIPTSGHPLLPQVVVTSSSEQPLAKQTATTPGTSVSLQNRQLAPPPKAVRQKVEQKMSPGFLGSEDMSVFKEFADMDIGSPGLGVNRLLVEAIHEYFVKKGWFLTAKSLQQEALGTIRRPRTSAMVRAERELAQKAVMAKPPPPWPATEKSAMYNWFEEYCRQQLFPATRVRQAQYQRHPPPSPPAVSAQRDTSGNNQAAGLGSSGLVAASSASRVANPPSSVSRSLGKRSVL
ncbi:hypothetical protein DACRYDRAFT_105557 [Dacryopinax primogenitus]|uniref:Uncharacterized protein n=1 Tax=Dacryopinax primogenitus (strain DJM 731) TaxID=1858805 RepID=M5GFW4_DACPD|nr:uncharacterized protein DACRYDRAFT_105557 [Dacryopinax primogenitus]EJU04498.1 hypothetical protein DACRYDRAFT_105557 [Dacryopinax primogenitus]